MALEVAEALWSAEAYLEWESAQPYKYELIDNRIVPMPGSSPSHNLINFDLAFVLTSRLESQRCQVFGIDIQLQVDPVSTYTYPDVMVVCGEAQFNYSQLPPKLENPTLLFEVLSPSTETRDRNRKREQYLGISSLQGYFLVAQDQPLIEAYTRAGTEWIYSECAGLDANLIIPALDCEIPLGEIYRRVNFDESESDVFASGSK